MTYAEIDLVTSAGGNIGSMSRCLDRLGVTYHLTGNNQPPRGDRPIVLPGVGAFGTVMNSLKENDFARTLQKLIGHGTPFLGICVGMQVLFDSSEEAPGVPGLGILGGDVVRYDAAKVPQIGWNKITPRQEIEKAEQWHPGFVYFVNSYYARPKNPDQTLYSADYVQTFCAAVQTENITAFQFHPEKSGDMGQSLITRWLSNVSK